MTRGRKQTESREQQAHGNKARPPRIKMNAGGKLQVPESIKQEGYQYYWAITGPDHAGKVEQMEGAYWEIVKDEGGNDYTVPAGNGNTHILMRIEQKYYDEDMADQQAQNIETTKRQAQTLGEDEYVPQGYSEVATRTREII